MSLTFAAITPHPPILIPSIGKDHLDKIENTVSAMKELEKIFYLSKPEVAIVISPHGGVLSDAFSVNFNPHYESDLAQFGDFSTRLEFKGDIQLINEIKECMLDENIIITSEEKLDHGTSVPLFYLTQHLKEIKLIPIVYSLLAFDTHIKLGECLKNVIFNSNKRIAVIASGDLSHCLTKDAPAHYNPKGKEFDEKLIELLESKDWSGVIKLDPELVEQGAECGLRSFLILGGIIKNINYQPELMSYEGPFGVGYLVMNFKVL